MRESETSIHGRGTGVNPKGRFDAIELALDAEALSPDDPGPRTQFLKDATRNILARNDSPDIAFDWSVNPYRGCEHGCIYCYARPTHEYLGFSAGLDFESKIMVKEKAPELLREALADPKWVPQPIHMSGVTDCYQPIERHLKLTRGCLEVLLDFRNPVTVITKHALVVRDADLFEQLAALDCAGVALSVTTLDDDVASAMEPRASRPQARLAAIEELAGRGIPVHVNVAPIVPGLTEHEIYPILAEARKRGARTAAYQIVRLPHGVADLFEQWLADRFPNHKEKVMHRIRSVRGGKRNDPRFGSRMRGEGPFAEEVKALFAIARDKAGFADSKHRLSTAHFRRPGRAQGTLFGG